MTIVLIIAAAACGLLIGIILGDWSARAAVRRSGYVIERQPGGTYRIGVRTDAAPVVPAVEWIAPARTRVPDIALPKTGSVVTPAGSLGHKPRGGGRP